MAVYLFYLRDDHIAQDDLLLTPEGQELQDIEAIARAALKEARTIMSHDVAYGRLILDQHIVVRDASGDTVHRLPFMQAIEIQWCDGVTALPVDVSAIG